MPRSGPFAFPLLTLSIACGTSATNPPLPSDPPPPESMDAPETDAPRALFLHIDGGPPPPVVLDLDRSQALTLFGEQAAKSLVLMNVDTKALLGSALDQIRGACGNAWNTNNRDPQPDCSQTPLGRSFGAGWRTSAEYAAVRLLTTTPANRFTRGTPLEDIESVFELNPGLGLDLGELLSKSLGVLRTDPILPQDALISALQRGLLGSHPRVADPSGRLPVTLYDALLDLTPLAEEFGPVGSPPFTGAGEHPGVLVPDDATFTTKSDVLLPTFRMRVTADSNLRFAEGVSLSSGAGGLFYAEAEPVLRFDFKDPEKLQIDGIAESPTIDMRIGLAEYPAFVPACAGAEACKTNFPADYRDPEGAPRGAPVGTGTVWTIPPWTFEQIVARSGLVAQGERVIHECPILGPRGCISGVKIGDPPGWATFINEVGSIVVPAPQLIWELLMVMAETGAHDPDGDGTPDLAEGQFHPVFPLRGVKIGLDRPQIEALLREGLSRQAAAISDVLVGRYWQRNGSLDFYYRPADSGGPPCLFFVAPSDPRPDPDDPEATLPYAHARPGFFSSPDLAEASRVSRTEIPGVADTVHEKYRLPEGETTLYAEDEAGDVYELRFFVPREAERAEITVSVKRW